MKEALVSVGSKSYLPGSKLMFYSFIKRNLDFQGDLLLIYEDLTEQNQEFGDTCKILDSKYNTFVLPKEELRNKQDFEKAAVWHYLRHGKVQTGLSDF